jgi:hypothetical protein
VYWYHKEVPLFFFEFCCGITEKIDVDDWTKRNNSQSKLNKIIVQFSESLGLGDFSKFPFLLESV